MITSDSESLLVASSLSTLGFLRRDLRGVAREPCTQRSATAQLVGVYLDKGRVSDTPESAETGISETPSRHFE